MTSKTHVYFLTRKEVILLGHSQGLTPAEDSVAYCALQKSSGSMCWGKAGLNQASRSLLRGFNVLMGCKGLQEACRVCRFPHFLCMEAFPFESPAGWGSEEPVWEMPA